MGRKIRGTDLSLHKYSNSDISEKQQYYCISKFEFEPLCDEDEALENDNIPLEIYTNIMNYYNAKQYKYTVSHGKTMTDSYFTKKKNAIKAGKELFEIRKLRLDTE